MVVRVLFCVPCFLRIKQIKQSLVKATDNTDDIGKKHKELLN